MEEEFQVVESPFGVMAFKSDKEYWKEVDKIAYEKDREDYPDGFFVNNYNKDILIGWAVISNAKYKDKIFLESIYVYSYFRNKGVGTEIIDAIKERYDIICGHADNPAVGFYIKNGFTVGESGPAKTYVEWIKDK